MDGYAEELIPVPIIVDMHSQEIRKWNLLEITVTNQPTLYCLQKIELEMVKRLITDELMAKIQEKKKLQVDDEEDSEEYDR